MHEEGGPLSEELDQIIAAVRERAQHGAGIAVDYLFDNVTSEGRLPGFAFAMLEGRDGQTQGAVLVTLDSDNAFRLVEFVGSLGNFSSEVRRDDA